MNVISLIMFIVVIIVIYEIVLKLLKLVAIHRLRALKEKVTEVMSRRPKLIIDYCEEEVTISLEDGREVVHWVEDEWIEDPGLISVICNAVMMANVHPEKLIKIHQHHIDCQEM